MTRKLISTGSPFEEKFAYSRAVVQGDWCFCAGTTGFDYATMTMPEDPAGQTRNIFRTIGKALDDAGFAMADTVRVQVTVHRAPCSLKRNALREPSRVLFALPGHQPIFFQFELFQKGSIALPHISIKVPEWS